MKKQLRAITLFTCLAAVAALGVPASWADTAPPVPAQGSGMHRHGRCDCRRDGHRHHRFFAKLARELQLTDEQQKAARALFKEERANDKPLFESLRGERHRLRNLVVSGTAGDAAIRAQSAKVAGLEADLAVSRAEGVKKFQALLTPKQQEQLKTLTTRWEHRFNKERRHERWRDAE